MTSFAPWYTFQQINNYGSYPDPEGPYPKPDINVLAPVGTPITALASGVISGINSPLGGGIPSWGQVVTVKLDNPVNGIATHMAYLHLGSIQSGLQVGQRVNAGDTLGYAGNSISGASTGFALYNGDYYGYGPSWSQYVGSASLDPTSVLNAANSGSWTPGTGDNTLTSILNTNLNTPNTNNTSNTANNAPNSFLGFDFTRFIDAGLLFVIGIILLVVGGLLLVNKMGLSTGSRGVQAA